MKTYETCATVDDQGQIHMAGVPFAPGTEVGIKISPKRQAEVEVPPPESNVLAVARERMRHRFRTIKGFTNSPRIRRGKLYEREWS